MSSPVSGTTSTLTTPDGTELFVRRWQPAGEARASVVIAHGMAEHSQRYDRLARALVDAGYAVTAYDHRGHGHTGTPENHGYLADENGWQLVVSDIGAVIAEARCALPGRPLALLGHSMGSFLSRDFAAQHSDEVDALVISGTGGDPGVLGKIGRGIARTESRVRGRRARSKLMDKLVFGQSNSAFKPARTDFDWLSRDPAEVDKYVADPLSGNVFTAGFYADMLGGLANLNKDSYVAGMRRDLPVLLISGDADPVGGPKGKQVQQVAAQLRRAGLTDVTLTLYPDARHELFNETNRDEVTADLVRWLDAHLVRS